MFISELPDLRVLDWVEIEMVVGNIPDASISQLGRRNRSTGISLPNVCVLMDDFQAREFAMKSEISVRGTLALLLMAKEKKYVQEVGPLINQL